MRSLGHYAYRWRGRIVLAAAALAIVAALVGSGVFDAVKPYGFQDPSSESARATEALEDATGERPLPDVVLVVDAPGAASRAQVRRAARRAERRLTAEVPEVRRTEIAAYSEDGGAALTVAYLDDDADDLAAVGDEVERAFDGDSAVTAGGSAVTAAQLNETTENDLRRIELVAAPILFLLSLIVFRGLVAALLPLVVGVLSIVTTLLMLRLLTGVMDIDVFVVNIVIGLGLGLAIDYSLFVVTRFREELDGARSTGEALRNTIGSTGRMIVFSGLTVAIALASLAVFPQRFLYSIGVGGALVALASVAVSLTVLPAMLALLGRGVNSLAPSGLQNPPSERRWYSLGRFVLRHPVPIASAVVVLMVILSVPVLRVELTRADPSVLPAESSAHRVDRIVDERFEGDPASVIDVVVVVVDGGSGARLREARRELARQGTVESIDGPQRIGPGLRRIDAQLNVDPFTDEALDAVDVARRLDWGSPTLVNGPPAELTDQRKSLSEHLPAAIAIIVVSTLLLLFLMTRSVVLPVVALLMNALTVGVAFGVVVWIFQDGRLEGFFDYTTQEALDTSMPILLFAVVFGLSTDYGVFLLQRIGESRPGAASEDDAIARGLAKSGRPITAAALLFAVAMGAFAFSDLVFIKEIAVGTALAVLVDATLVRPLLFPALLGVLGSRAWWAPRRLGGGDVREEPGLS